MGRILGAVPLQDIPGTSGDPEYGIVAAHHIPAGFRRKHGGLRSRKEIEPWLLEVNCAGGCWREA